jgi:hypothetical protein
MLTDQEKQIVASFKPWVKAFKRRNYDKCGAIEKAWHDEAWRLELSEKHRANGIAAAAKNPWFKSGPRQRAGDRL